MKNIILLLFICFSFGAFAQNTSGIIKFRRKTDYIKMMDRLPWMTEEDKERAELTRGNWGKGKGALHELHFNGDQSIYFYKPEESGSGYSWKSDEFKIIRDYKKGRSDDIIETLGKRYHVQDIPKYKWKILNEIKEIGGYLCMKAETEDPIKDQTIHAWFTDAIPVQGGPEGYYGLPGMILEINKNNGAAVITAESVEIAENTIDLPIPKKIKGKKVDREKLNSIYEKYIEDSKASQRNPFWSLRF